MIDLIRRRPKRYPPVICGRRYDGYRVAAWPADLAAAQAIRGWSPIPDRWRTGRGGLIGQERIGPSCSYCGSLHPDALLDKLTAGWILEGSDKAYKWYLARPYTDEERAARPEWLRDTETHMHAAHNVPTGETVAKFYTPHLTREHCEQVLAMWRDKTLNHSMYVQPWMPALNNDAPDWLVTGTVAR